MPLYDFRCEDCSAVSEVLVDFENSQNIHLVCTNCGGDMEAETVMALNIHAGLTKTDPVSSSTPTRRKCGHKHHCRCHIKLDRPNPFTKEIRAANGIVDEA